MMHNVNFQGDIVEIELSDYEFQCWTDYNTKPASMITKDVYDQAFKTGKKILKEFKEKGAFKKFGEVITELRNSKISLKDIKAEMKKYEDKDKEEFDKDNLLFMFVGKPYQAKAGRGDGHREIIPELKVYKSTRKEGGTNFYPYAKFTPNVTSSKGFIEFKASLNELKTNEKQNAFIIDLMSHQKNGLKWAKENEKFINKLIQVEFGIKSFKFMQELTKDYVLEIKEEVKE